MKKILLNIAIIALIFAVGCDDDDERYPFTPGAGVHISSDGLTELDGQVVFDVTATNAECTELTVTGDASGTVTLTNGEGSFTASAADLGISDAEDVATLVFTANSEGNPIYEYSVEVADPISTTAPTVYESDEEVYLNFEIDPVSATVSDVTVEVKVNSGTYTALTESYNAEDSVMIVGSDYALGDKVFFRITGEAGTLSSSKVDSIVVGMYSYENMETFMLDSTTNLAYDLIEMTEVDVTTAGDSADIELVVTEFTGGYTLGFVSNQNAEFVATTDTAYWEADINVTEATDFTSAITTDTDVEEGDAFVFRTKRAADTDYTYGILMVKSVMKPQGVIEDSYIEFEVKY